jgi:hypothetical protein
MKKRISRDVLFKLSRDGVLMMSFVMFGVVKIALCLGGGELAL